MMILDSDQIQKKVAAAAAATLNAIVCYSIWPSKRKKIVLHDFGTHSKLRNVPATIAI